MWLKVDDGKVIFATYLIRCQLIKELKERVPFQIETEGVICYSDEELACVETELKGLNVLYTIEQLTHDPAHVAKAQGVKYASRNEAIEHILNDKEPESMIVSNLKKKLAEKDDEIKTMRANLEKIEVNMKKLNDAYHRLEATLNQTKMPI